MDEALGQVQAFAIIAAGLGLTPMVAATPSWPISEAGEGVGWGRCMAGAWRGGQGVSGRLEGGASARSVSAQYDVYFVLPP